MLAKINEAGIVMRDGRYVATLEQLQRLVNLAKNVMVVDKAYEYMLEYDCTQTVAAKKFGITQPALAQYIKRLKGKTR